MMKKKCISSRIFLLLIFSFIAIKTFAQFEASKWFMGYNISGTGFMTIDFVNSPWHIDTASQQMSFFETNASICDKNGNLLFCTNGIWIANSLGDTMQNGNRINSGNFPNYWVTDGLPVIQGALILPLPEDSNKYYIFHNCPSMIGTNPSMATNMYFTLVDMSLDNGLGGIVSKNNLIFNDTIHQGEITACRHGNGRDWWILIHQFRSNLFYRLLVTPLGISVNGTQSIGTLRNKSSGEACFSPNGKWYTQYNGDTELNLYKFDRCSGMLSNYVGHNFNDSSIIGGVAFSPNSKLLYVTSRSRYLYQFNLEDSDIIASKIKIDTWDGTYSPNPPFAANFYLMQLMSDNKIYMIPSNGTKTFHVINFPDSLGFACNFVQHFIQMPSYNGQTIPNFPNYYLGADSGSVCDTLQLGIKSFPKNEVLELKVFPNPVNDRLQLSYTPDDKVKQLEIIDVNGKVVLQRKLPQWSQMQKIDVSKLPEGIYLCRVQSSKKTTSLKFVKVIF